MMRIPFLYDGMPPSNFLNLKFLPIVLLLWVLDSILFVSERSLTVHLGKGRNSLLFAAVFLCSALPTSEPFPSLLFYWPISNVKQDTERGPKILGKQPS
jgi:hypothetical protein